MKKLVESMAGKIPGYKDNPDIRVVNEVVVRSVINALLRGMSPKYSLVVHRESSGTKYSYHVDVPGTNVDVDAMREACAIVTLEKSLSELEGLECLCRYLFTIHAFMPECIVGLSRSLGNSSADTSGLKAALSCVSSFVAQVLRLRGAGICAKRVAWGAVYAMCLKKLLPPLLSMHPKERASVAYCVYTSSAAIEITKRRDDLKRFLMSEDVVRSGGAAALHEKLTLLSNLNPAIAAHYKVRESIDPRRRSATLMVRGHARIMQSLSNDHEWSHIVNGRVNKTIRYNAKVNAETLLLVSMLLSTPIAIKKDNIGALILNDGAVAYSFKRDYAFPLLGDKKLHDGLGSGILSTPEGKGLVNLLIESHHLRQRCVFGVSYEWLAIEVRKLSNCFNMSNIDQDGNVSGIFSHAVRYVHDALVGDKDFDKEIIANAKDVVSFLAERVSFLREFVDSRDYPVLCEFLEQSSSVDTHRDFARYLKEKRACDEEKKKEEEKRLEGRRTQKLMRAMGELVGFMLMISGMLSVCFAVYAKQNALTAAGLPFGMGMSESVVLGLVVFSLGFVATTTAWASAKGAASAFKRLKSVCTLSKGEEISTALSTDVEYHLQIPEGVDVNSVGFIGTCSMDDFRALVDECAGENKSSQGDKGRRGRAKKDVSLSFAPHEAVLPRIESDSDSPNRVLALAGSSSLSKAGAASHSTGKNMVSALIERMKGGGDVRARSLSEAALC